MRAGIPLWQRSLTLLMLLFVLLSLLPAPTLAQDPAATPTPAGADPTPNATEIVPVVETTPVEANDPTTEPPSTAEPADAGSATTPSPDAEQVIISSVQGVVRLDVSVAPARIRAGDSVTYTYIYTNTGAQTATGIIVRTIWTRFHQDNRSGNWQYCDTSDQRPAQPSENATASKCGILNGSVQGSATVLEQLADSSGNNVEFQISDLAPGQSGRFSIRLLTRNDIYPQTGRSPTRPAGSGQLFLNNNKSTPISEDTANTLIEGPVFVLSKAAAPNTPAKVYPLDTVEFIITVGNATASGDVIDGSIRTDAIAATNVLVRDTFPSGSEFVSADGNFTVNQTNRQVSWTIASLTPGQSVQLRVRFRKLDVNQACGALNNSTYNVTSDEMPIRSGSDRYVIAGKSANVSVVTPMVIQSITADPSNPIYGDTAVIRIVVQNYWYQAVNGAQLNYFIQSNAFYVPGSATPSPSSAPNGAQPGGTVNWTFNMPAGNATTPTELTFTLTIRGGYTSTVQSGTGQAQIIAPANVPSQCLRNRSGRASLQPRLVLTKDTTSDEYFVEKGDEYPFFIEVENRGSEDAIGVTIRDLLPASPGNFRYVSGSARLNGSPLEPSSLVDGPGGTLTWNNISIPAGESIRLEYNMVIDGLEYVNLCNTAEAVLNDERISYINRRVCVKINPPMALTKTVLNPKEQYSPGEEVRFRLTLTNNASSAYEVGLYDVMGRFAYVRQESGYGTPQTDAQGNLQWPLRNLSPGQTLEAVFVARFPNECVTRDYVNEIRFLFRSEGETYIIRQSPPVTVKLKVSCGTNTIEYRKSVNRQTISLQDRVTYTINIKNANTTAQINNITVVDVLPPGFSYVGMDGSSNVTSAPQQVTRSDGRVKLTWTISSIAAGRTTNVVFIARSGDIVGRFENWLTATAPDLLEARCTSNCKTVEDEGSVVSYSAPVVAVEPLITMEPRITNETCATAGDIRSYRLSLVNTNSIPYRDTTVALKLPFGMRFKRILGSTPVPAVATSIGGETTVTWSKLTVPAKPANQAAAQVVLEIEMEIGQVWEDLATQVQITSPDGLIPRKDGVADPIVKICVDRAAISKEASRLQVNRNDELIYRITVVNPTDSAINVSLEDVLPENTSYLARVTGPTPTVEGNRLSWSNISVAAATDQGPGLAKMEFRVRVNSGSDGAGFTNTVTVVNSSTTLDTTYNAVEVFITRLYYVYVPFTQR